MITFYDIKTDKLLEPKLEFETKLTIPPTAFFQKNQLQIFSVGLASNTADIYLDEKTIYRITPDFKFKLDPKNIPTNYEKIKVYSAEKSYLELLEQLLQLEPCFKIKVTQDITQEELKKLILSSSCRQGFLEINSFQDEIILEELIITSEDDLKHVEIIPNEKINRILIYDIERNSTFCNIGKPRFAPQVGNQRQDPSNLHKKLFELIFNYIEKNVSQKLTWDLSFDRDSIYRQPTTPETLNASFNAIKKAIEMIKVNKQEHAERIKKLIEIFYSENYAEIEKLNLTTEFEKFYIEI